MPFKVSFFSSYERCVKRLGTRERRVAGVVVLALRSYFEDESSVTGRPYVFQHDGRGHRLIFKKLRGNVWEAYIEGQVRVLTRLDKNVHFLIFAGNHDQVRQFLKEE